MNSVSEQLAAEAQRAVQRIEHHRAAQRVLQGSASREALALYYVNAHAIVKNAARFLSESHVRLVASGGKPQLIALLEEKQQQESGHERWLEDDLCVLGLPLGGPFTPAPSAAPALYNAFHEQAIALDGHSFLGTAFILESLAVRCAARAAYALRRAGHILGLTADSERGLSFLLRHHDADIDHTAALGAALDAFVSDVEARAHEIALSVIDAPLPLSLAVEATPAAVAPGDRVFYTATIENTSNRALDDLLLVMRVPSIAQFAYTADAEPDVSACNGSTCRANTEAHWKLGSLASGASQIVTVNALSPDTTVAGSLANASYRLSATGMAAPIYVSTTVPTE